MAYSEVWEIEVRHEGLSKYRHIRGSNRDVVEQKARAQKAQWEKQWQRRLEMEQKAREREAGIAEKERARITALQKKETAKETAAREKAALIQAKEEKKKSAQEQTVEAELAISALRSMLAHAISVDDTINWAALKEGSATAEDTPKLVLPKPPKRFTPPPLPESPLLPQEPPPIVPLAEISAPKLPTEPDPLAPEFQPEIGLLERVFPSRRASALAQAKAHWESSHEEWKNICCKAREEHAERVAQREEQMSQLEALQAQKLADWKIAVAQAETNDAKARQAWESNQERDRQQAELAALEWHQRCEALRAAHAKAEAAWISRKNEIDASIDENRRRWLEGEAGAVIDYCDMVLSNSIYPECFPRDWDLEYIQETRTLVLDYALPAPENLPTLKEVQYVQTRDEFKRVDISERELSSLYDDTLYQVALRTLHELFEADKANVLYAIVFNGLVTALDKSSGHKETACIMSLQAGKDEFMAINLAQIDPKACFKAMKGVAASKLVGLASVPPVLKITRSDRRFVDAYAVADTLDDSTNLASMHWEDFEHLIREVFEKEFSSSGGEVRVTQASRDGGVDAVAFDPDPIRGGKIVIQAKRYINTVGVSAVRDLYGTVMNEGATKGVLVSTAHFGPDAYEFAKGKPLTLLDGGNLLHLLEKHGHRARINLQEAKAAQRVADASCREGN